MTRWQVLLLVMLPLALTLKVELAKNSNKSLVEIDQAVGIQIKSIHYIRRKHERGADVYIPIRSPSKMGYYGHVRLGTPSQPFRIMFDTGSAEFWVPSIACRVDQCVDRMQFDPEESSTFRYSGDGFERFQISYVKGSLIGDVCVDTLQIGRAVLERHPFGLADYIGPKSFDGADFDGICGLCSSRVSSIRGPALIEHLKHSGAIDEMIFSIHLESLTKGSLLFGNFELEAFHGKLEWLETVGKSDWRVQMDAFKVGKTERDCPGSTAVIDSGSNMILIPTAYFEEIAKHLKARRLMNHLWEVDCSSSKTLPTLGFVLDGLLLNLNPSDYIHRDDGSKCVLSLVPYNAAFGTRSLWILGEPFLRVYYAVFDAERRRIGLALSTK